MILGLTHLPGLFNQYCLPKAFETVLAQADYQDGLIDAAEIEAWYENTRQLYKSSAAIYDEVVCRCAEDIDTRPRRGYGCDSIDNDCDNDIDELVSLSRLFRVKILFYSTASL